MDAIFPLSAGLKDSLENTKCEYRQLGKSGLRVSVPILGAMSIGSDQWMNWVLSEGQVRMLLHPSYGCSVD